MNKILKKFKKALDDFGLSAPEILLRDKTGECIGECRNRVREGEVKRQKEINVSGVEAAGTFPNVQSAYSRNDPPGSMGGHV